MLEIATYVIVLMIKTHSSTFGQMMNSKLELEPVVVCRLALSVLER